ncbi:hypothetical protein EYV94_25730 [Puteibacter caeruleilacunae]|nr:hypothetical protein EYV94_25730 [Puteibacter caeruleilacunae]
MKCKCIQTCLLILTVLLGSLVTSCNQSTYQVNSPNERLSLTFKTDSGKLYYFVDRGGKRVVNESAMGLVTELITLENFIVKGVESSSFSEDWEPVWGQFASIKNEYNEVVLHLEASENKDIKMDVIARVFDNGIGLRYHFPEQNQKHWVVKSDLTEFNFPEGSSTYSTNGESTPKGPTPIKQLKNAKPPVVVEMQEGYAAIHEADLMNFSFMRIGANDSGIPTPQISKSTLDAPFNTPWRVVLFEEKLGDLALSHVIQNLNSPCKIADTSWIKSGIGMTECRAWGATLADGFQYGKNMESLKRFIDFCHENGMEYIMVDSGWYGNQWDDESDPFTPRQEGDNVSAARFYRGPIEVIDRLRGAIVMPELIKYGRERNVGVIVYMNDLLRRNHGMSFVDDVLKTYANWGAAGIKYGFMKENNPQKKVNNTRHIVAECAKNKLLVNFHDGPVHPTGEDRTYPNLITREFVQAQFDASKAFGPTCFLRSIFVNAIAGPLDFMNGFFELESEMVKERFQVRQTLNSTVVAEAARCLIASNGLNILSDHDEAYRKKADIFEFVRQTKGQWDETRILHDEMGRLATFARRKGDTWLIGSHINEKGGSVTIPLDFLSDGAYHARIFTDGENTDYKHNKEDYRIDDRTVSNKDVLTFNIPAGGGVCIELKK